jgi:hypothetical protein
MKALRAPSFFSVLEGLHKWSWGKIGGGGWSGAPISTIIPADQMVDQLLLVKDQIYTLPVAVMEIYNKLE